MSIGPLSASRTIHGKSPRRIWRALNWRGAREVVFWLLLLGTWRFLDAPSAQKGFIGCIGTVAFLIFASVSLDRLRELGLDHARWRSVPGRIWLLGAATGCIAGGAVFALALLFGQGMKLSEDD